MMMWSVQMRLETLNLYTAGGQRDLESEFDDPEELDDDEYEDEDGDGDAETVEESSADADGEDEFDNFDPIEEEEEEEEEEESSITGEDSVDDYAYDDEL